MRSIIILLLAAAGIANAQLVITPQSKITGPNGASVDTASGVSINPGSGGAVNVVSGDTYVPTRIDFSTTVSPTLTAAGHAAIAYDGTHLLLSVNGGAYSTLGGADVGTANTWAAKQTFRLTTNQAEWGYDASNYARLTVDSTGNTAIAATGTNPDITITPGGTGAVAFPQVGGVAGTDELRLSHNGTSAVFRNMNTSVAVSATFDFLSSGTNLGNLRASQLNLSNTAGGTVGVQLVSGTLIRMSSTGVGQFSSTSAADSESYDTGYGRNAAGVFEIDNGTLGTYRDLLARGLRSNAVTFTNAISSPVEGTIQAFTDSSTATWGATITGGGSNHVLGYYNGTNWTVLGK